MNELHLSDETIEEIVDGDLTHSGHLDACVSCRERVAAATDLWRQLLAMPDAIPVHPSTWSGVQRRLHGSVIPRIVRFAAAAAAAIVIFASGFFAATVRAKRDTTNLPAPSLAAQPVAAATIQRAGSEYVASLASFASDDPYVASQAREAALAAIHGASIELAKLSPDDPAAAELSRVVRDELSARAQKSPVRF